MTKFFYWQSESNGQWYWHLKSPNSQTIATGGEGYKNERDCLHAIGLVMDTTRQTPVQKL
jgi:uncharacterized protein YegP (UPF0339 family)